MKVKWQKAGEHPQEEHYLLGRRAVQLYQNLHRDLSVEWAQLIDEDNNVQASFDRTELARSAKAVFGALI